MNSLKIYDVQLVPITDPIRKTALIKGTCQYCEQIIETNCRMNNRLHPDNFYCSTCLRYGLNTKFEKNVLGVSFRGIVAHYYYQLYIHHKLYLVQIEDMIRVHERIGLDNPAFLYNPDAMLWSIDFAKVGNSKIKLSEVKRSLRDMLNCFQVTQFQIEEEPILEGIYQAVSAWHLKRTPPEGKFVVPLLKSNLNTDLIRNFFLEDLVLQ